MQGKIKKTSIPFCICPSLFDTHPNKAKYSIYEKLSRVFIVAGFRFQEK